MLQLMIEFLGRGQTGAAAAAQGIGRALDKAAQSAEKFQKPMEKVQSAMQGAANRLLGLVRAGMSGTTEMNQLAFQIHRIQREIANVFAPWIRKTIELLNELRQKLQALSGAQQETIRNWVAGGLAVFALIKGLGRVVMAFSAIKAMRTLSGEFVSKGSKAAMEGMGTKGPGVLGVIGNLAIGLGALLATTEEGRAVLASLWESIKPLVEAVAELAQSFAQVIMEPLRLFAGALKWLVKGIKWVVDRLIELINRLNPLPSQSAEAKRFAADPELMKKLREAVSKGEGLNTGADRVGGHYLMAEGARKLLEEIEKGAEKDRDALGEARAGREDPREMIKRIQESALKDQLPKKQLKVQEDIRDIIKGIVDGWKNPQPPPPMPGLGL